MLEATFSPLIPCEQSEEFYRTFYQQYSLIQINDILFSGMIESTDPLSKPIVTIDSYHLNFFRNFALSLVECLEKALHPEAYDVGTVDPLKI